MGWRGGMARRELGDEDVAAGGGGERHGAIARGVGAVDDLGEDFAVVQRPGLPWVGSVLGGMARRWVVAGATKSAAIRYKKWLYS